MANRKVQVTAASFARRRVVGGLVRPGSGNAGEGAPRPFRWVVGSAFAAVAVVAVAAVGGYLDPPKQNPLQTDLITDDQGTQYVMLAGTLHPVLDSTSAHLLLGPTPSVTTAPEKALAPYRGKQGSVVGIRGLPPELPPPVALDLRDWTACTAAGHTVMEIGFPMPGSAHDLAASDGPASSAALMVADDQGKEWVVDDGVRYLVQDRRAVAAAFQNSGLKPRRVPSDWLDGLPAGDPLGVPAISGRFGQEVRHAAPPGFDRVGMFGKSVTATGTAYYVVTAQGLALLTPTMYDLYQRDPRLASLRFTESSVAPSLITPGMLASPTQLSWPAQPPVFSAAWQAQDAPGYLCAWFDGSFDQQGTAHVVVGSSNALPVPPDPGRSLLVEPGHGAVVRASGSDPATATTYLLTDNGTRYELVGDAAARLGYAGIAAAEVPADWLRQVPLGPALDPEKAAHPAP